MISPDRKERLIEIGVVGKPHGIRGGVNVYLHNPESDLSAYLDKLLLLTKKNQKEPHKIEQLTPTSRGYIAFIENIKDRQQADSLKGSKLYVHRRDLPVPGPDEFYIEDLIGLKAFDGETPLGQIISSRQSGDIEVVTVQDETHQLDIPLVDDFVEEIDFEKDHILLRSTDELPRSPLVKRN